MKSLIHPTTLERSLSGWPTLVYSEPFMISLSGKVIPLQYIAMFSHNGNEGQNKVKFRILVSLTSSFQSNFGIFPLFGDSRDIDWNTERYIEGYDMQRSWVETLQGSRWTKNISALSCWDSTNLMWLQKDFLWTWKRWISQQCTELPREVILFKHETIKLTEVVSSGHVHG